MRYDCLIIDDEKLLADNTSEYFNMFDVKTVAVYSGSEAEAFLKDNQASLILLDINLSDGSGFAICKKIRETMDVPILFISARNTDDDKIIALNIGGDDYVEKPYSLGVLLAKVYFDEENPKEDNIERYGLNRRTFDRYFSIVFGDEEGDDDYEG